MINADDVGPDDEATRFAGLRIGTPERQTAENALEAHLVAKRLNAAEYGQRVEACQHARTWAELLRIFDDLPLPHPELPSATAPPDTDEDDDMPPAAVAGCLALGLGLPVAVRLRSLVGSRRAYSGHRRDGLRGAVTLPRDVPGRPTMIQGLRRDHRPASPAVGSNRHIGPPGHGATDPAHRAIMSA